MQTAGVDRLAALYSAIDIVRRGGTISLIGVYGGTADPMPHDDPVRQADPAADGSGQRQALGRRHHAAARPTTTRWASTRSPPTGCRWTEAPHAYEIFQQKPTARSRSC